MFQPPPSRAAFEWSGTIVGVSNAVTRVRGPVAGERVSDDARAGELVQLAQRALAGPESYVQDAVVHGIGVRLFSDSRHVADFWRDGWFGPQDWRERTGLVPPAAPRVTVYVIGNAPEAKAYVARDTVLVFGSTCYGTARAEVLGVVGRILAEEQGAWLFRASAAVRDGKALLCAGDYRTTRAFQLMDGVGTRFLSDDIVVLRHAFRRRAGGWMSPTAVTGSDGTGTRGWRAFQWLEKNAADGKARVSGVSEDGRPTELNLGDLDLAAVTTFVYPVERGAYVRTGLVRDFPHHTWTLIQSKIENAPEVSIAEAQAAFGLDGVAKGAAAVADATARSYFESLPSTKLREILLRFTNFDNARALVDPARAFGRSRTVTNPWEPVAVGGVALAGTSGGEAVTWERYEERMRSQGANEAILTLAKLLHRASKVFEGRSGRG